ncbi:MAG: O-antigen ligase family protein [Candidatus Aminicenantes bacterium]|nr:MAG: O-antigen ligase family protein [Candidatus Aminicenantes bacterium]
MTKSGWLLLPAAFFLIVNFAVSSVNTLFFSRLIYFLFLIFLFLILRQFNLNNILPPIIGGVSLILFFYGIIQKFVLFPYYLQYITPGDDFYSQALITRIKSGRIFSLFSLPTLYAIICTVLIIFILHYLLTSLTAKNKRNKIFWGFLLLTGLFNLVLTQSFGGFLYFSIGVLLYLLLSGILKFKYLAPLLMVLSLFFFIIITLRFSEAKELEPVKLRFSNWKQASRIIESAPFWGIGLGNYEAKISYYTFPSEARSMYAHNFFLQFTAETGFIIPCILLLFLFVARKKLKPHQYKEKIIYIAVILVVLVYNVIDIGLYFFSAGVTAAIALSQVYPHKGEKKILKKNTKLIMNIIVFALLSFLLLGETISENHRKTADFLDAQKDYENAQHDYQKSFKINPFNYNSMVRYAYIDLRFNKPQNAEKYLDKALKLYPDLAFANYLKSQIQFKRNHLFKAYYHAAAAYNKYKLSDQYKQWFESIKRNLENLLVENSRLPITNKEKSTIK